MDPRFHFFQTCDPTSTSQPNRNLTDLPIECTFEHRATGAKGLAAMQYWPPVRDMNIVKKSDQVDEDEPRNVNEEDEDVEFKVESRRPPEQVIVFVPGNPGLLNFYVPFLNHLHSCLPPTHAILSVSHIGHDPRSSFPTVKPLDLPLQLEAKVELLHTLRTSLDAWSGHFSSSSPSSSSSSSSLSGNTNEEQTSRTKTRTIINLVGHSVGAWMVIEIIKLFKVEDLGKGILLFPTLGWIAKSWNGRTLWPIFHRPLRPILPFLSNLLHPILPLLPTSILPPTTQTFLSSPRTIHHTLYLARSEMVHIQKPDLDWYKVNRGRLYGVWAGKGMDGWVGVEGPLIRDAIKGKRDGKTQETDTKTDSIKILDDVPHAFCISEQQSILVAEIVAGFLLSTSKSSSSEPSGRIESTPPIGSATVPM